MYNVGDYTVRFGDSVDYIHISHQLPRLHYKKWLSFGQIHNHTQPHKFLPIHHWKHTPTNSHYFYDFSPIVQCVCGVFFFFLAILCARHVATVGRSYRHTTTATTTTTADRVLYSMHNERPMPTPLPPRRSHTPPSYISLGKYEKKTNVPAPFATNRNLCGNRKNVFIIDWPIDSSNINFYFFYSRKVEQNTLETVCIVYRKYLYYRCEEIRALYMHPRLCLASYFFVLGCEYMWRFFSHFHV